MDDSINMRAAKTATDKRIIAHELPLNDVLTLLRDIADSIFNKDDKKDLLTFYLPMCDVMAQYLKLHYFFREDFAEITDINKFFDDYVNNKYEDYIYEMNKTNTVLFVDKAVETYKNVTLAKLQNPMTATLDTINKILTDYADNLDGITAEDVKQFIANFSEFSKNNNTETITNVMLEKAATAAES